MFQTFVKKAGVAALILLLVAADAGPATFTVLHQAAESALREQNIVDKIYLAQKNKNVVDNFRFAPRVAEAALDPNELEYMIDVGPINGSTTANYVYAAFFNPTGSGRTAVVKRIAVRANAVAAANYVNLSVRRITASSAGTQVAAADIPRKNTGSSNPVLTVRHTGPTVTFAGVVNSRIMGQAMPGEVGQFHSYRDITFGPGDEKLILQPGEGIAVYQEAAGDADQRIRAYVEWEEVAIAPAAQSEFLFTFPRVTNAAGVNYVYNSFFNPSASGRTAIVKRVWFGSETCDAAAIYTNNIVLRRISAASGGTQVLGSQIPKKHTGSADSVMDIRHTGVTVTQVGGADARLGHVTPCAVAGQPHGWMQIDLHANDEKLILQPGQGIALISEAAGDVDQLNRMIIEWQEVASASTPASRGEYIFASNRTEVAAALGTTFHTFFNPTGSGRTAVVNRLVIRVDADAAATYSDWNFQRISAASGGLLVAAADIPKKHTGTPDSAMEFRWCGTTCGSAITATYTGHRSITAGGISNSGIFKATGPGAVGQIIGQREIVFGGNEKFILREGEGLGFYLNRAAGDVDHYVKILIEWDEETTAPGSRNEYLIDIGSVGGSTSATFNYISFFNPSASGRTAIVKRVSVRVDTAAAALYIPLRLRRTTAASGGTLIAAADIPRKHTLTANSAMDIRHTNVTNTYVGGVDASFINVETPGAVGTAIAPSTSGYREIVFETDERIILQPGEGIALGQTVAGDADFRVKMLVEWEEVAVASTPASAGEYLMTTEPVTGSLDSGHVYATFFNPVGSGRNYVVTRIGIRANRSGALTAPGYIPITLRRVTAASGGTLVASSDLPRKHAGTGTPTAEVRRAGVTATLAGVTDSRLFGVTAPGAVNQNIGVYESEIISGDELILAPGEGIALFQEAAAGDTLIRFRFSFQWREALIVVTPPAFEQSNYRWFENIDGVTSAFGTGGVVNSNPSTGSDVLRSVATNPATGHMWVVGEDVSPGNEQWRIEKRRMDTGALVTGFGTGGVVTSNPSGAIDIARAIAIDPAAGHMWVVGEDRIPGALDAQWRIEKRRLDTGALVTTFGTGGVVTSNPSTATDIPRAIAIDPAAGHMWVAGEDRIPGASDAQWRIEKRALATGALVTGFGTGGVITSNPSTGADRVDIAHAIAIDPAAGHMWVAGEDRIPVDAQWRIEKRRLDTGALVTTFGTGGVVTSNPTLDLDILYSIAINISAGTMYAVGYEEDLSIMPRLNGHGMWRIEKRRLDTGALVTAFGTGGVVTSNPSTDSDTPYAITIDPAAGHMWVVGEDDVPGNAQWRIEKRRLDTGALVTAFGTGGVVTSNPSTGWEISSSIAIDPAAGHMWVVGDDISPGNAQWRIEKRRLDTGALVTSVMVVDVGSPLAAQNTAATLTTAGGPFRLRQLIRVSTAPVLINAQDFRLQFSARSGVCDTGFVGETYADVTTTTVIAFHDNPVLPDNTALTANVNDPFLTAVTTRNQTYEELNPFINSVSAIAVGEAGMWDFSLRDNGAPAGASYCLRVVRADGTPLNTYTSVAEITTATAHALTFSISDNLIGFGSLSSGAARFATGDGTGSATEVGAHDIIIGTGAANGYTLTVSGTTLQSGAHTITAIGPTNTASAVGTEQFGLRMTASGGIGTVSAPYAAAGFAFDTAAFPDEVASATGPSANTTFSVRYLANIATMTEAGTYTANLTYIVTANF